MRSSGFAHRNVFGSSIARWLLIIAAGSAATACSGDRLGNNAVGSPQTNDRYRLNRALVELALGQTKAALADAPRMDEAGLRQTLAIYWPPPRDKASARGDRAGAPAASGKSDESSLPNAYLAVDPPTAVAAATMAATKPVAGLPPTVSP